MVDKVTVDNGALTDYDTLTDTRTIGGQTGEVQRTDEIGATAVATAQVVPTTTAATLVAARDSRKLVTFVNYTGSDVYLGPATVTTANGWKLPPGASDEWRTTALVQCIIPAGTAVGHVAVREEYDS